MSQQLDRARRFLSSRYGVDASTLNEQEVVQRASVILGVRRTDSVAGMLAAIDLRLDAEWSEDDHPRAEDGKFSGGGGSASKSETGSSGDHAARASDLAKQARAVASGTTPAARASARKAEESAAAARAAHEQGNHAEAARHAAAAAKHAADVDRKVAAHVPASERGLNEKQMRQEGGATPGKVVRESDKPPSSNSKAAEMSAAALEKSRIANGSTNGSLHQQAGYAHTAAAAAHSSARNHAAAEAHGDAARAHGDAMRAIQSMRAARGGLAMKGRRESAERSGAQALAHAQTAQAKSGGKTRDVDGGSATPPPAPPPHPAAVAALDASKRAYEATARANATDTPAAHREAARLHGEALVHNRSIGASADMRTHGRDMEAHEERAAKLEGKTPAAAATDRALKASETAYTGERHLEAEQLHREASHAQSKSGNAGAARAHEEAADSHKIAAALGGSRLTTSADRSGSASSVAQHFAAEAKHLNDNPKTDRKSDASGNLVHRSQVDDYEHSGDTQNHADRLKSLGAHVVDTRDQYFDEDHGRGDVFFKLPKGVSASQFRQVDDAHHDVHSSWSTSEPAKEHLNRAVTAVRTGRGEDAVKHAAEASRLGREHAEAMRRR